jgi:hypothetical protein
MSKNNDKKSLYERQESKISAQSNAFITLLTKRGILADQSIDDPKIRKAQKLKKRNSYHNTLMLLQHYRTIAWVMECFPSAIAEELGEPLTNLDALLDRVDLELTMENRKVDQRIESVKKSRLLIERVNEALTVLKKKPADGKILYDLIYLTYIAPEQISITEIMYRLGVSHRQYYRLREQAITILSIRLWAAPAPEVDYWLEMMTLLEELEK